MKKIVSLFLSLCLLSTPILHINAFASNTPIQSEGYHITHDSIEGVIANNYNSLFSGSTSTSFLRDIELTYSDSEINLSTFISDGNSEILSIITDGKLYTFTSESNSITYLVDFEDTNQIHFVQAKIEELASPYLSLTLQAYDTLEFMYFEIPLSCIFVDTAKANTISNDNKKAFELYHASKNFISPVTSHMEISYSSNSDFAVDIIKNGIKMPNTRADYTTSISFSVWDNFLSSVRISPVNKTTYAIDHRILNEGFNFFHNNVSTAANYTIATYAEPNGANETLIQIMMLEVVDNALSTEASAKLKVEYNLYLTYNDLDRKYSLLFDNMGLTAKDVYVASYMNSAAPNNAIFVNNRITSSLASTSALAKAFYGLVPYSSSISDIWAAISPDPENNTNGYSVYPDTVNEQIDRYGKVVRIISASTGNSKFTKKNHSLSVQGSIRNGRSGCTNYNYKYSIIPD